MLGVIGEVLMTRGYPRVAKAYILYCQQRAEVRRLKKTIGVDDDLKLIVNSNDLMEQVAQRRTLRSITRASEDIRRVFVTDRDIAPEWHVRMQALFQKHTDNSVSKTVSLPHEATPEAIRRIHTLAHELKCKGITIYRYGSKKQPVLTLAGYLP